MCCIVLKLYYLCVVIGDKPVISYHEFLKYSSLTIRSSLHPLLLERAGVRSKSKAMKKLFSEKNLTQIQFCRTGFTGVKN